MKKYKKGICIFIILTLPLNISGCTAYIEISDLPLILGAAVDKDDNGEYILTVEVFKPSAAPKEQGTKTTTAIFQTKGKTIFEAVRDLTIKLDKRAYWTHLKVFIVSKKIAKEGMLPILDYFNRNAHIRKEFPVLISNDENAYEIFYKGKQTISEPVSIFIHDTVKSVDKISKYDYVKFYEFIDDMSTKGQGAVLPLISMNPIVGKKMPSVYGIAVFKKDKMVGTLDSNESKTLRLLKNKEKGGLLILQWAENNKRENVTLEIFKSKTKIEPLYNNKELSINIKITTIAEIAEIMNPNIEILDEKGREELKKKAEKKIKNDVEKLMFKLQHKYQSDAVGFGKKIKEKKPKVWKEYESNWSDIYQTIPLNISINVEFRGTASTSEEIKFKE